MKELKLVLDPKTAARVATVLHKYANEERDQLIETVATAIESKLEGRRGRYK